MRLLRNQSPALANITSNERDCLARYHLLVKLDTINHPTAAADDDRMAAFVSAIATRLFQTHSHHPSDLAEPARLAATLSFLGEQAWDLFCAAAPNAGLTTNRLHTRPADRPTPEID